MTTVTLEFDTKIDLEDGEEILFKCMNNPKLEFKLSLKSIREYFDDVEQKNHGSNVMATACYQKGNTLGETLKSKFTFGIAGPKLAFPTNLVITNKRLILIPNDNSKRTKEENYTTQSFYYNKDIKGASAFLTQNEKDFAEKTNACLILNPVKGVNLKGLWISLDLRLSWDEFKAVSASMIEQARRKREMAEVDNLAGSIEYDGFFDAFSTHTRVAAWKSSMKEKNKISVLGDRSILPIRDFIVWTINNAAAEAK